MAHTRTQAAAMVVALVIVFTLICSKGLAIFIRIDEPVPVDRLVKNLSQHVQENPRDAAGHYTLGRVHSLAFAKRAYGEQNPDTVNVIPVETLREQQRKQGQPPAEPINLPKFGADTSVQVGEHYKKPPTPSPEARQHLEASLQHYRRATELREEEALYWLGYGWMAEQAAVYLEQEAPPAQEASGPSQAAPATRPATQSATQPASTSPAGEAGLEAGPAVWRERAMQAYHKVLELKLEMDLELKSYLAMGDSLLSREAAQGVLRLIEADGVQETERGEIQRMEKAIEQLEQIPMAITPIIFSLETSADGSQDPARLIDASARVEFDLAGDGVQRQWPWVRPETAILVWDPERSGQIRSGRQLFGSVTWWMFWDNGYEALAALDNDGDGYLRGDELAGIAAWFDRNGDGASNDGEVVSLASLGVTGLRIDHQPHPADNVTAWQPAGMEMQDGRTLPTWDWQPVSKPSVAVMSGAGRVR